MKQTDSVSSLPTQVPNTKSPKSGTPAAHSDTSAISTSCTNHALDEVSEEEIEEEVRWSVCERGRREEKIDCMSQEKVA